MAGAEGDVGARDGASAAAAPAPSDAPAARPAAPRDANGAEGDDFATDSISASGSQSRGALEDPVLRALREVESLSQAGQPVRGVVVADAHGLCLAARGDGDPALAGRLSSLAQRASALPGSGMPVVTVEGERTTVLVQRAGDLSVAVYTATPAAAAAEG